MERLKAGTSLLFTYLLRDLGEKPFIEKSTAEMKLELDDLIARLYGKLRQLLARFHWRGDSLTLSLTVTVHEAYLRLRKPMADMPAQSHEELTGVRQILETRRSGRECAERSSVNKASPHFRARYFLSYAINAKHGKICYREIRLRVRATTRPNFLYSAISRMVSMDSCFAG